MPLDDAAADLLRQQVDALAQRAAAADAAAAQQAAAAAQQAQQAQRIARLEGEVRAMDEAGRRAKGAGTAAGANSPGTHRHQWEGARMRDADSLISFDFTSGACASAITQPYEEAAADAAKWAGCRGSDGVLVGRWRIQSRCELEWRKREALANNPGSAIHALYDCRTGFTHLVLLRYDRVAAQHEVANLCRRLWVSSVEVDGPGVFEQFCREHYVWTRKSLCPVELEIYLRRMQNEGTMQKAAAAAEQREKEAAAAANAVAAAEAEEAAAEAAAAEAAAAEAAAAEVAVAEMEAVSLIASTADVGVLPTAVPVHSTAPPEGRQQHVHDAMETAGQIVVCEEPDFPLVDEMDVETAGQIVVCEEPDSPLVDKMDVVPSTIFGLVDVHLLEEDGGGATGVESSNSSSSSSSSSYDDVSSDGGFGDSGDIDRHGSWILLEVLPPIDFGDFGEVHLLEEQNTDGISEGSYSSSSSSSSSDSNGDETDSNGYQTGRDGGEGNGKGGKGGKRPADGAPVRSGQGFWRLGDGRRKPGCVCFGDGVRRVLHHQQQHNLLGF